MKCFVVERTDKIGWCEDISMVVVAEDEKHAEKAARCNSGDFAKAPLKVTEVPQDSEKIILVTNKGG
jgi:hypothetical protein